MAWIRNGQHRYYSRSHRQGKTVRRVHLGNGPVAEAAELLDQMRRADRQEQREAFEAAEEVRDAADALLDDLDRLARLLLRTELVAAGYHRHDRGP
ncbi:hypothetical protein BH23PLA1_BH23PLA1_44220 [soil metagenome]